MQEGSGSFAFEDVAAGERGHIRVFYHLPKQIDPGINILVALHGLDRAASTFRDAFIGASERLGRVVVVPEFDAAAFPGVFAYNYGNVVGPPPSSLLHDRSAWSFSLIDRLFRHLLRNEWAPTAKFDLHGNSAGSQFVLRCVALDQAAFLQTAIVSNSGLYMLPDLSMPYPGGMGGIGLTEAHLRRYLARPIRILLGGNDTDATAVDLPRGPDADLQGEHRLARGLWHYERCKALARQLQTRFGWTVEVVPNAGHISQAIFDRAMTIRD